MAQVRPAPTDPLAALTKTSSTSEAHSRWHGRTNSIWENVLAHGADPTGVSDSTSAVQAAVDAAAATQSDGRAIVFFPPGSYSISLLVLTNKPVTMQGANSRGTFLTFDGTAHGILVNNSVPVTGYNFYDLCFRFASDTTSYDCISLTKAELSVIARCTFAGARRGLDFAVDGKLNSVTDCIFGSNNLTGIKLGSGSDQNTIHGNWIDENLSIGIDCNGSANAIVGNRFMDNTTDSLKLDTSAVRNTVTGNTFMAGTSYGTSIAVDCYGDYNIIADNTVDNHGGTNDIVLRAGGDNNVVHNNNGPSTVTVSDGGSGNRVMDTAAGYWDFSSGQVRASSSANPSLRVGSYSGSKSAAGGLGVAAASEFSADLFATASIGVGEITSPATAIEVKHATPRLRVSTTTPTVADYYVDDTGMVLRNQTASKTWRFLDSTGAIQFSVSDAGLAYIKGEIEIDGALNHDGSTVGFYGTTPIAKQTGVAVDAAGIHAALVALGLFSA